VFTSLLAIMKNIINTLLILFILTNVSLYGQYETRNPYGWCDSIVEVQSVKLIVDSVLIDYSVVNSRSGYYNTSLGRNWIEADVIIICENLDSLQLQKAMFLISQKEELDELFCFESCIRLGTYYSSIRLSSNRSKPLLGHFKNE
jgi:hypothetical protein